jgi:hypothetical protein
MLIKMIGTEDLYKGREGLYMRLVENAPPYEVYDATNFPVHIYLENKGVSDINGELLLILDDNLRLDEGSINERISLKGRSIANPEGERETKMYSLTSYLFSGLETMPSVIRLLASYPYQTTALANVCIDTDPFNEKASLGIQKACSLKTISLSSGQGAPVAVTSIEPMKIGSTEEIIPTFKITVENVGNGEVYTDGIANIVKIQALLVESVMECDDEEIRLDKKSFTICRSISAVSKDVPSYTSLLKVELDYTYKEAISKEIQIKNMNI